MPDAPTNPLSAALAPAGDTPGVTATDVELILNAFPPEAFTFLLSEHPRDYTAILLQLRWAQFGSGELRHDELYDAAAPIIEQLTGERLDHRLFQSRLKELLDWKLIHHELDARSTQSINDFLWSYHRYRLTDNGSRLLNMLERAARGRGRRATSTDVKHSLRTILDRLNAILRRLRELGQDSVQSILQLHQEQYQDLAKVFRQEFHDFKEYLGDLNHILLEFGRHANPANLDDLDRIKNRLEAYVTEMLNFFAEHSRAIAETCSNLHQNHLGELNLGYEKELLDAQDPITGSAPSLETHPPPLVALIAVRNYFRGGSAGTLQEAVRRIQDSTLLTISNLRIHIIRLLERTRFAERLRLRLSEVLSFTPTNQSTFDAVVDWAGELFEPFFVPTAPFLGTPTDPGEPHQPRRYKEYVRTPLTGIKPTTPVGEPDEVQNQERILVDQIERFVEERILRGGDQGRLADLDAPSFQEFRLLLEALKHSNLVVNNAIGQRFTFTVEDPRQRRQDPVVLVEWATGEARYTAPSLIVRRRISKPVIHVAR